MAVMRSDDFPRGAISIVGNREDRFAPEFDPIDSIAMVAGGYSPEILIVPFTADQLTLVALSNPIGMNDE
jgi:hypothetical protein